MSLSVSNVYMSNAASIPICSAVSNTARLRAPQFSSELTCSGSYSASIIWMFGLKLRLRCGTSCVVGRAKLSQMYSLSLSLITAIQCEPGCPALSTLTMYDPFLFGMRFEGYTPRNDTNICLPMLSNSWLLVDPTPTSFCVFVKLCS